MDNRNTELNRRYRSLVHRSPVVDIHYDIIWLVISTFYGVHVIKPSTVDIIKYTAK